MLQLYIGDTEASEENTVLTPIRMSIFNLWNIIFQHYLKLSEGFARINASILHLMF